MRVISGTARGVRLTAPKGLDVRPTLDRVREALFSILGGRVTGARFLDLFAGTGANGIEALSRGAECAVFVENNPLSLRAVEQNLNAAKCAAHARVVRATLPGGLSAAKGYGPFDLVFADPPYRFVDHDSLFSALTGSGLLAQNALIVIEHAAKNELPEAFGNLRQEQTRAYGDTALSFYAATQG